MLLCVGALGCTFLDSGIGAIHRWIRLGPLALNAAFAFVPVALIGMDPVSYTHLDVYKRQQLHLLQRGDSLS